MKSVRKLCIAILIVTAIAAIVGGVMLIKDDTGRSLQLSIDDLKGSFFTDYNLIGWILIIAVGIFSTVSAVVILLHHKLYPYFILIQGLLLALFVVLEYYTISYQLSEVVFGFMAIALLLLGNLLRKNLKVIVNPTEQSSAEKHPHKKSHYHKHRKRGHS
ncbi:MAG: hypothetical protein KGL19_13960 [Bacteroidota bacterium]|nr:hypothetical protein [Bacteroidota bacterium]